MNVIRFFRIHVFVSCIALFSVGSTAPAYAVVFLTDSAVFSSNDKGENWNGWIWNTQAPPDDTANRWNLYYSSSADPMNPVFINSQNGPTTNINIAMTPGSHTFLVYGETVTTSLDPLQHFVLSLYFGDNQGRADISGLYGAACPIVCAVSHWNGLDLFGNSGLGGNTNATEAGTLEFASGGTTITLTGFTWNVAENVDRVWPHWDNTAPYSGGSGTPDFVGEITLRVTSVPEPAMIPVFAVGFAGLGFAARRRIARKIPPGPGSFWLKRNRPDSA